MHIKLKNAFFASLALWIGFAEATAQVVEGAPSALIGKYGRSPEQCRSYHRKSDNITSITKDYYTFCGGSLCEAKIVSNYKTKDGFILKLTSRGNVNGWTETLRQIDENVFEVRSDGRTPETLVRCTIKDAIAGIGRETNGAKSVTQSMSVVFSAYYAQSVPFACPDLRAAQAKIEKLINIGEVAWLDHIVKYKLSDERRTLREQVRQSMAVTKSGARGGVLSDAKEIPDFCERVLDAFGTGGDVIPDLLIDPRKKA